MDILKIDRAVVEANQLTFQTEGSIWARLDKEGELIHLNLDLARLVAQRADVHGIYARLMLAALAERTEQCAKIAEQGLGMMVKVRDLKPSMSEEWKVDNEGIAVKRTVASAIRALNQPEKENVSNS